jgi:hypothetical protein
MRAAMRADGPATGYSCAMPGGWALLDGQAQRRAASVRRAVRERVRRDRRLAPHIAHLDRLLAHECAVAAARGALWVSLLAEPCDGRVLTAAATLTIADLTPSRPGAGGILRRRQGDLEPTAAELLDHVTPEHARTAAGDPAAYLGVVTLPQQQGLVRRWRQVGPYGGESRVTHHIWQLILSWPGRPAAGVLTYSTPCEPLRADIGALFDACCRSFRWTWDRPPSD